MDRNSSADHKVVVRQNDHLQGRVLLGVIKPHDLFIFLRPYAIVELAWVFSLRNVLFEGFFLRQCKSNFVGFILQPECTGL